MTRKYFAFFASGIALVMLACTLASFPLAQSQSSTEIAPNEIPSAEPPSTLAYPTQTNPTSAQARPRFVKAWSRSASNSLTLPFFISGDTLITGDSRELLVCVERKSGQTKWTWEDFLRDTDRIVAIDERIVLISRGTPENAQRLFAFDLVSGNRLWKFDATTPDASMLLWQNSLAVRDGLVIAGRGVSHKELVAFDESTGNSKWTHSFEIPRFLQRPNLRILESGSVLWEWDRIYEAVDVKSGKTLWKNKWDNQQFVAEYRSMILAMDELDLSKTTVTAFDSVKGTNVWKASGFGLGGFGHIQMNFKSAGDRIFLWPTSLDKSAVGLFINANTGVVLWNWGIESIGTPITVQDNFVILGSPRHETIYVRDRGSGKQLWSAETEATYSYRWMGRTGNTIAIATDKNIIGFDLNTGKTKWKKAVNKIGEVANVGSFVVGTADQSDGEIVFSLNLGTGDFGMLGSFEDDVELIFAGEDYFLTRVRTFQSNMLNMYQLQR